MMLPPLTLPPLRLPTLSESGFPDSGLIPTREASVPQGPCVFVKYAWTFAFPCDSSLSHIANAGYRKRLWCEKVHTRTRRHKRRKPITAGRLRAADATRRSKE